MINNFIFGKNFQKNFLYHFLEILKFLASYVSLKSWIRDWNFYYIFRNHFAAIVTPEFFRFPKKSKSGPPQGSIQSQSSPKIWLKSKTYVFWKFCSKVQCLNSGSHTALPPHLRIWILTIRLDITLIIFYAYWISMKIFT